MMMKVDEGLPKMFQRYNGKPTLMTASTRLAQVQQRPNATTCRLVFAILVLCVCSCIHVLPQGLLTRLGERQGPGYLEADANLRIWCYPARAGIYSLWCAALAPPRSYSSSAGWL